MMKHDPKSGPGEMTGRSSLSDIGTLISRAWPDGLSDQDVSLLRKLSLEEEELVRMRLLALLEVEAGIRPASLPPQGDPRGISSSGFQSLVRRWRADRSVQTLLPYAGRTSRTRSDTLSHRAVADIIDDMLRADPRASLVTISKVALDQSGVDLALNTVRSLARERRTAMMSDGTWLAENYGRHLLADVCALASTISADDGDGDAVAAIALVVECASGIVLGHSVGPIGSAPALQRSAMAAGLTTIITESVDVDSDSPTTLTVVLAPDAPAAYAAVLREVAPDAAVVDSPRRRPGDRVADLLDGSIDILPLRPRGGRASRRAENASWVATRLAAAAQQAVDTHNRDRLEKIRNAISDDRLAPMGRMVEVLRPLVDLG